MYKNRILSLSFYTYPTISPIPLCFLDPQVTRKAGPSDDVTTPWPITLGPSCKVSLVPMYHRSPRVILDLLWPTERDRLSTEACSD